MYHPSGEKNLALETTKVLYANAGGKFTTISLLTIRKQERGDCLKKNKMGGFWCFFFGRRQRGENARDSMKFMFCTYGTVKNKTALSKMEGCCCRGRTENISPPPPKKKSLYTRAATNLIMLQSELSFQVLSQSRRLKMAADST